MPADFPSTPTLNQTYTFGDRTWKWNGTGWALQSNLLSTAQLADGAVTTAKLADGAVTTAKLAVVEIDGGAAATVYLTNTFTTIDGGPA